MPSRTSARPVNRAKRCGATPGIRVAKKPKTWTWAWRSTPAIDIAEVPRYSHDNIAIPSGVPTVSVAPNASSANGR